MTMQMPSSISTRLHYQHKTLLDIIEGLSDEQIRRQVVTGKWSIFENIVHLQTYQHTMVARIKQMLENSSPLFPRYGAETDPEFIENCGKTTREIMQDMITVRKLMASEISSFPPEDLIKTGTHPVFGEMTILQWVNFFLLHEAHHLFAIYKLAAELKKVGG